MTSHEDRCAICSGTRQEHGPQTKHEFTMNPGELKMRPREDSQARRQEPSTPALAVIGKLIEVLVENEVITPEQGLSCFGVKVARPEPTGVTHVDYQPAGAEPSSSS